jgi:hypothetical protein
VTGLAVRIFIVGVIVVGGIVFRDRLTGGAGDLKAGDCFDSKVATEVKDIQHHPCNEGHNAEVVLVTDNPAAKGAAYPTDSELEAWAGNTCVPTIIAYVGASADLSTLNYGMFYPKVEDWNSGERRMICYTMRLDMAPMTQSLHAGTP